MLGVRAGWLVPVAWFACRLLPERSRHWLTAVPEVVRVDASAASSHRASGVPRSVGAHARPARAVAGVLAGPVPPALVAVTVTEYSVPGVSPPIVQPGRSNSTAAMTAFAFALVFVTVSVTVPPAVTLTGTSIHRPALNPDSATVRVTPPTVNDTFWVRMLVSQSSAYTRIVNEAGFANVNVVVYVPLWYQVLARRAPPAGSCTPRVSAPVSAPHRKRAPLVV